MKIALAVTAALLASGGAFAQQAPMNWQCHTLASSGNYLAPDEQIVNGMACKAVPAPTAYTKVQSQVAFNTTAAQAAAPAAPAPVPASVPASGPASGTTAQMASVTPPLPQEQAAPFSATPSVHTMPVVFISGTGNSSTRGTFFGGKHFSTGEVTQDQRDQTIELAQDFSKEKECSSIKTTVNQQDADYTVNLNHQAFHGLAHKNDQIMVTDRDGEVVSAESTHSVTGAVKNACSNILVDFNKQHAAN